MNWKRVIASLEQSAQDRRNMAQMSADRQQPEDAKRMVETAHLLSEMAYALKVGLEEERRSQAPKEGENG